MANLILWRHAEAEDDSTTGLDADRALTKTGRKDAARMAKWLNEYLPKNTEVLSSPAKRCLETVSALNQLTGGKRNYHINIEAYLGVDTTVETISKQLLDEDSSKTKLIVGHQPNLGLLIAKILGMKDSAVVKKGAVWWLRQRSVNGVIQTYLFTVQNPDY